MGISESDDRSAAASSTPQDDSGDGPVTLEDRTEPGGEGSPGSNQARTEPVSPTGNHPEPLAVPDLDDMNVGSGDPQAPRHPDALGSRLSDTGAYAHEPAGDSPTDLGGPGSPPDRTRPEHDATASTGRAPGPEKPLQETTGTAHRVPGEQGETPQGESVTTDVEAGAARMGPQATDSTRGQSPGQGDDQSVPVPGDRPAPGSSEEHRVVAGIKLPEPSEDEPQS